MLGKMSSLSCLRHTCGQEMLIPDCHWDVIVCYTAKAVWYTLHLSILLTFSTALITICNGITSLFTTITGERIREGNRPLNEPDASPRSAGATDAGTHLRPSWSILHLTQHCTLPKKKKCFSMKQVRNFSPSFQSLGFGDWFKTKQSRKQFFPWQEKTTQEEATC